MIIITVVIIIIFNITISNHIIKIKLYLDKMHLTCSWAKQLQCNLLLAGSTNIARTGYTFYKYASLLNTIIASVEAPFS